MLRNTPLIFNFGPQLVGEIKSNMAVVGEWTNTQDMVIRSTEIFGNNFANFESAAVRWDIPNRLRVQDDAVGVDDVSIIALKVFRSALLKNQAVRQMAYSGAR
jgi:hypothetical protein